MLKLISCVLALGIKGPRWLKYSSLIIPLEVTVIPHQKYNHTDNDNCNCCNHCDYNVPRKLCNFDLFLLFSYENYFSKKNKLRLKTSLVGNTGSDKDQLRAFWSCAL